ncbi:MAG TPA: DUF1501 domain-containing protein, partial [Desulfuromonadaceae bacterium]|nr:DUF1501 domain-containing protein [Desulfuromonadaceae bacterium]
LGVALSTLVDIPFVMKRALAEGTIGLNGKKLLFIFLRGANDGLNSVIPIQDPAYNTTNRPNILIPKDVATDYSVTGACDLPSINAQPVDPTFNNYPYAIRLGNGFSALHPSLKFLAPVYNAGDLALIHRVGYPKQSRSHFDSQNYWENGSPNNKISQDGIFYRTMIESGLANRAPLTGVSIQSSLPLLLRGSKAAMTNLTDPTRYNLFGIPSGTGDAKADSAIVAANEYPFSDKHSRELLSLQYGNMVNTLQIFAGINFTDAGNTFKDDANTDNDAPYYLFPTSNAKNGGYALHANDPQKYVVDTGAYSFFNNLKAAALILNKTDAIIAGTQLDGFDTHNVQGAVTGSHANLQRRIGWAMYALRKYFLNYHDKATWDNLVVVTLSEFGRTTIQNTSLGTDHAEAGVMFLAGGAVKGFNKGRPTGVIGGSPNDSIPWVPGQTGSMFGVPLTNGRYLKRCVDYRSVLGEIIRDHLGATQNQLNRIIPGYANAGEKLLSGGVSSIDGTNITGEVDVV